MSSLKDQIAQEIGDIPYPIINPILYMYIYIYICIYTYLFIWTMNLLKAIWTFRISSEEFRAPREKGP